MAQKTKEQRQLELPQLFLRHVKTTVWAKRQEQGLFISTMKSVAASELHSNASKTYLSFTRLFHLPFIYKGIHILLHEV